MANLRPFRAVLHILIEKTLTAPRDIGIDYTGHGTRGHSPPQCRDLYRFLGLDADFDLPRLPLSRL
jgi:hypothetical protein